MGKQLTRDVRCLTDNSKKRTYQQSVTAEVARPMVTITKKRQAKERWPGLSSNRTASHVKEPGGLVLP
jgi:hypothetical protein